MSKHVLKFTEGEDGQSEVITLDGKELVTTNHDEDGWSGMERVRTTLTSFAEALNIEVVRA